MEKRRVGVYESMMKPVVGPKDLVGPQECNYFLNWENIFLYFKMWQKIILT